PRHSVGIDGMWQWADGRDARLGVEWYYTGEQRLEANPYRERSRPYHVFGVRYERRVGRARLFANGENLTDARRRRALDRRRLGAARGPRDQRRRAAVVLRVRFKLRVGSCSAGL